MLQIKIKLREKKLLFNTEMVLKFKQDLDELNEDREWHVPSFAPNSLGILRNWTNENQLSTRTETCLKIKMNVFFSSFET